MSGRLFAVCALAAIAALIVVGAVSDGVVRHVIQTLPLWLVVVLGLRDSPLTKWAALPIFVIWLAIMALIWLFLLRIANVVSGHYSPTEIVMTLAVGVGSLAAIAGFWRAKAGASPHAAAAVTVVAAMLQVGVIALSLRDPISSDSALMAWLQSSR